MGKLDPAKVNPLSGVAARAIMRRSLEVCGYAVPDGASEEDVRRFYAYTALRDEALVLHHAFGVEWETLAGIMQGMGDVIDQRKSEDDQPNFRDSFP